MHTHLQQKQQQQQQSSPIFAMKRFQVTQEPFGHCQPFKFRGKNCMYTKDTDMSWLFLWHDEMRRRHTHLLSMIVVFRGSHAWSVRNVTEYVCFVGLFIHAFIRRRAKKRLLRQRTISKVLNDNHILLPELHAIVLKELECIE